MVQMDWSFLARFCFISGRGQYEYEIEFDRRLGEPQLLLYYDDKTQWPSVYKSDKTCREKLSVLSRIDNQIVTLSARSPDSRTSGCTILPKNSQKQPIPAPATTLTPIELTTLPENESEIAATETIFDKFLRRTTVLPTGHRQVKSLDNITEEIQDNEFSESMETFNETEVFNSTSQHGSRKNGGGLYYKHDVGLENVLENTTEYKVDVEELFEPQKKSERIDYDDNSLDERQPRSNPTLSFRPNRETYIVRCHNTGTFISSRERWWFIAVANCGNNKGLDIKYRFRMTNGNTGDFWHEHFSADERLIPPILLCQFIVYSFLVVALFFCTIELKSMHLYHCTYRLFAFSLMMQYIGIVILGIAWIRYGMTGLGPHTTIGGLLLGVAEIAFLLLLLLMAKGYTITRARLSSCSIVKLTIFINTYIVAYIILYIYQAEAFDPGEVLNLYESPAGFGLSLLRCVSWCVFMISTAATIRKYPEKSSFYYPFGLLGSCWILGGPFLTLIGIGILDAWVRESVMYLTFAMLAFMGHSTFLWITWPSRANKSFPYHVKTNHIGIASEDDDGADYPRHTYEPTHVDQNIIIPLSRRTEELINGIYGQYMYDQPRTGSNAHSHASFPEDPHAPAEILSSKQLQNEIYEADTERRFSAYCQKPAFCGGDVSQPQSCTMVDDYDENDSGHPSLDQSGSPSNNTTKSISDGESPVKDLQKYCTESAKANQFVEDEQKAAPNKIILEPIEKSIKNMKLPAIVPRHLFAAKKEKSDENPELA
ncbi:transmembrane protein 145-like isoform X2 [Sitodiplosis mosellana]|uniref:transmembrane protein 145-like isoform X2 n=1 Tax=Sitodiplosis mosellana TaxID=263140 RepID=UPI002444C817|nr:transmembrane protein 145-like isoform X2 [Sitodiplosis mosellana]